MLTKIYYWLHRLISKPQERRKHSSGYWQDMVRQETLVLCRGQSGKILEVGCGEGLFLAQLAIQNPALEIWGVDIDSERLKDVEKLFKEKNLRHINLSLQDAGNLSFADEYFDVVICINVLLVLNSLELVRQVLWQITRVCKKRGKIVFDFRNSRNPFLVAKYKFARYYDHTVRNLSLTTYNLEQIERILKDLNLDIVKKRFLGFPLSKRFAPIILIEAEKRC